MKEAFTLEPKINELSDELEMGTDQSIEELIQDFFVVDKDSDPEHNIYKGKCLDCGSEFSVNVLRGIKGDFKKHLDQVTEEVLRSKKCHTCRNK